MTVYVDESIFPFRGTFYCHVWADSIDELHVTAQRAGLRREWFQEPPKARWQHYDCAPRIRSLLIAAGAVETDRYGSTVFIDANERLLKSDNPKVIEHAWKRINVIRAFRARKPGTDLFATLTPEIDYAACLDRWNWYQVRKRDFIEW